MANCPNCGAQTNEGDRTCLNCGTELVEVDVQSVGSPPPPPNFGQYGAPNQQNPYANPQGQGGYPGGPPQGQYSQPPAAYSQAGHPGGHYPPSEQSDIDNNKIMAVLSYFGLLVLIPIFAAKDSKFARYHANQGLVLMLFSIGYGVIAMVLQAIMMSMLFTSSSGVAIYGIVSTVLSLGWIFFLVLAILGIINAAKGEFKPLPLIGGIQILK